MLKCFFLFQFHTTCCFNNIMVYFMSLFVVYSSRILSTVAMLVTCDISRGFFFLSQSVYIYLPNDSPRSMFLFCFNLFFSTYFVSFPFISAFCLLLFCHTLFVSSLLSVSTPLLSPFLSFTEIILLK